MVLILCLDTDGERDKVALVKMPGDDFDVGMLVVGLLADALGHLVVRRAHDVHFVETQHHR